eukprot:747644-Hanusia_phi.AAC.2
MQSAAAQGLISLSITPGITVDDAVAELLLSDACSPQSFDSFLKDEQDGCFESSLGALSRADHRKLPATDHCSSWSHAQGSQRSAPQC